MGYGIKVKDHAENVCEEIILFTGLEAKVIEKSKIEIDTIAGKMIYIPSEKNVMKDVYRFIMYYGLKLHNWGLQKKIQ